MKNFLKTGVVVILCMPLLSLKYAEKKIKEKKVPQAIRVYIKEQYPAFKKVKYYLEMIRDTLYYEAELKNKKEKLSLLFYENGTLCEVEKEVEFENLPALTRANIINEFKSRFQAYKILEVEFLNPHLNIQYEVQVKGRSGSAEKYYEFVFAADGKMIRYEEKVLMPIPTLF